MNTLVLSCALVAAGLYGVLTRRDLVAVLASIEVMLGGASLLLVAYAAPGVATAAAGQGYALLVLAVGAAEAAVGIALLVSLIRRGRTRSEDITEVRG
ncbi:MAG TPA: NADH-quinone oxidoreductase subunit NuoK [Coriobacteriia bacterium]